MLTHGGDPSARMAFSRLADDFAPPVGSHPLRSLWGYGGPFEVTVGGNEAMALPRALSRREPVGACSTAALFTAACLPPLFVTYFPSFRSK